MSGKEQIKICLYENYAKIKYVAVVHLMKDKIYQ